MDYSWHLGSRKLPRVAPRTSFPRARSVELCAPPAFVHWVCPSYDFESCWNTCLDPAWLLWAAARLCRTSRERYDVVSCAAAVAGLVMGDPGHGDPRVVAAITGAQAWASGASSPSLLLAAEMRAREAAASAAARAMLQATRARVLLAHTPRRRLATAIASHALTAQLAARAAYRQESVALAAAWTARSAIEADAATDSAEEWATAVGRVGAYASGVSGVLSPAPQGWSRRTSAANRCAALIKSRLPPPHIE